jgi:hypothetical protein
MKGTMSPLSNSNLRIHLRQILDNELVLTNLPSFHENIVSLSSLIPVSVGF